MVRPLILAAAALLPLMLPSASIAQAAPANDTITLSDAQKAEIDQQKADHAGVNAQAESGQPVKRIRNIALTGTTPCPKASSADEVVVCSRVDEPYRIPKRLRDQKPIPAQNQSWVNRVAAMDDVGRKAAGLPDSCSPVGSGGQTGCTAEMLRESAAENVARRNGQSIDPLHP